MFLNKTQMTVTTEDGGRTNMWATEPRMYVDPSYTEAYGLETHAERAAPLPFLPSLLVFAAALLSYSTTGSVFFFGLFGF